MYFDLSDSVPANNDQRLNQRLWTIRFFINSLGLVSVFVLLHVIFVEGFMLRLQLTFISLFMHFSA